MSVTRTMTRVIVNVDHDGTIHNVNVVCTVKMVNPDNPDMAMENTEYEEVLLDDLNAGDKTAFAATLARGKTLIKRVKPLIKP